jgi:integrase
MPRGKNKDRDGVYARKDRSGQFYGSWIDATGARRRRKLNAHTLQQARSLVAAEKARVEKQQTLGYAPPSRETFGAAVPRYLQFQKPRISQRSYERTAGIVEKQLRPIFGAMRLGNIRRVDIQEYVTQRSGAISPGSVLKELNVLKHFLGLAVEWDMIPFNPALKVKSPRVPAGRVRYLQPTELRTLLAACPGWLRPIAALAAFTAMRRGEIIKLRWLDVDLDGGRVLLPQTKNGDGRVVYLNGLATNVVRSQWHQNVKPLDRVFPLIANCTADNISKGFQAVCQRLEIEDFHFHDLRHTAASWLRMQGADIHTVAQLLGHRDLRMAARYQHLSPEFLSEAVGRLDVIFGETNGAILCPTVTTASPEIFHVENNTGQTIDSVGSVIGDRTRTLRLESGLPGPQRDQRFSRSGEGRMTISCSVYAGLTSLISQNLRP